MKLNFKTTMLASALVLLSLSACFSDDSKNKSASTNHVALTLPAIPTTKTTGHVDEIKTSLGKVLNLKKDDKSEISFDENNYVADQDTFDISNLKVLDQSHNIVTVERMVKDSNKSIQMENVKYKDITAEGKNKNVTVKKITIVGDTSKEKNIDLALSADNLVVNTSVREKDYSINIDSINLQAKITDAGVEKFNINTQGLDFGNGLAEESQGVLESLKGSFAFYKTNASVSDNNYIANSDFNIGYDSTDKSKTANVKEDTKIQLDNNVIKSLFGSYKKALNGDLDATKTQSDSLKNTTKFVSIILNFANNGFMDYQLKNKEQYSKSLKDPKSKDMLKIAYKGYLGQYKLLTDTELDNFVDVIFNTLLNNKDLHISVKAVTPDTLENIQSKIMNKEKALTIQATN